ncbi:MAG: alginate export family protein [Methylococcaceae bacterium]|nr:alginate export family protein [Methylococcaceae bacterium]
MACSRFELFFSAMLQAFRIVELGMHRLTILTILALTLIETVYAGTKPDSDTRFSSQLFDPPSINGTGKGVQEPFDPNAPPKPSIRIAPYLTLGGQASIESKTERNFGVSGDPDDDFSYFESYLSLAFLFDPNKHIQIYANPIIRKRVAFEEPQNKIQDPQLEMNLAYLGLSKFIGNTSLYVGRQRFKDPRRWLFGENLDAAKLAYQNDKFSMEFSASRKNKFEFDFLNKDPLDSGAKFINYYSYLKYEVNKKTDIGFFVLYQDDQSITDQHPIQFGIQSEGEIIKHLDYWVQGALVRGTDKFKKIRGEAIDVGFTYQFDTRLKPSITLGYAYGSGDKNSNDDVDTAFRQSGFQDNEDKFNGVTRLQYYGEILNPRLSNLMIFTSGIGIRPSQRSSVDVVYHYISQVYASDRISGDDLNTNPTGLNSDIGSELDLVAGYQEIKNINTKFVLGYFWPGRAFPETASDGAFLAKLQARYSF